MAKTTTSEDKETNKSENQPQHKAILFQESDSPRTKSVAQCSIGQRRAVHRTGTGLSRSVPSRIERARDKAAQDGARIILSERAGGSVRLCRPELAVGICRGVSRRLGPCWRIDDELMARVGEQPVHHPLDQAVEPALYVRIRVGLCAQLCWRVEVRASACSRSGCRSCVRIIACM